MERRNWFAAKRYGYGLTPVTWEGWAVVVGAIAANLLIILAAAMIIDSTAAMVAITTASTLIVVTALVAVSFAHGEKPRWRWGK